MAFVLRSHFGHLVRPENDLHLHVPRLFHFSIKTMDVKQMSMNVAKIATLTKFIWGVEMLSKYAICLGFRSPTFVQNIDIRSTPYTLSGTPAMSASQNTVNIFPSTNAFGSTSSLLNTGNI